jgi:hypothetical protein
VAGRGRKKKAPAVPDGPGTEIVATPEQDARLLASTKGGLRDVAGTMLTDPVFILRLRDAYARELRGEKMPASIMKTLFGAAMKERKQSDAPKQIVFAVQIINGKPTCVTETSGAGDAPTIDAVVVDGAPQGSD